MGLTFTGSGLGTYMLGVPYPQLCLCYYAGKKNNLNNFKSIGRMLIFKITTFLEYKMLNLPIYFAKQGRL